MSTPSSTKSSIGTRSPSVSSTNVTTANRSTTRVRSKQTNSLRDDSHTAGMQRDPQQNDTGASGRASMASNDNSIPDVAQLYLNSITEHSKRLKNTSLFPGVNYRQFVALLNNERRHKSGDSNPAAAKPFSFAVLHDLMKGRDQTDRVIYFNEQSQASIGETVCHSQEGAWLTFLRGSPSARWIKTIGSGLKIDPELFRRQLDISGSPFHDLPALPSASSRMITIDVISIGKCLISSAQKPDSNELMRQHAQDIQSISTMGEAGTSIVRDFFWHDDEYFSIRQDCSIYVQNEGRNWFGLVLLDTGKDLFEKADAPWTKLLGGRLPVTDVFEPTTRVKSRIALGGRKTNRLPSQEDKASICSSKTTQSSALLHTSLYGNELDENLVKTSPFYALSTIFDFCASSENQLLNLTWSVLQSEARQPEKEIFSGKSLSLFRRHKRLLQDRINHMQATLAFLQDGGCEAWPVPSEQELAKAQNRERLERTRAMLVKDYDYLIRRATYLMQICIDEIENIRNVVTLAESRKAADQAVSVGRITVLAFLFAPLSFTTSLFGTNFREVGNDLSIWIWVVVTVPLCLIVLAVGGWAKWKGVRVACRKVLARLRKH